MVFQHYNLFANKTALQNVTESLIIVKKMKKKDEKYEAIYKDIEQSFRGFFGTKVKLDAGLKKGKIIISYNSNDDLERILQLIK